MSKPSIQELQPGELKVGSKIMTYRRWNVDLNTKWKYDSIPAFVIEESEDLSCTGTECSRLKFKHGKKFVCGHVRALKELLQLS